MKVLESNLEHAMKLAEEILNSSDLHDTKRLAELIAQVKSRLQVNLSSSGHTVAAMRALSYESVYAFYNDATIGIAYNQMIRRLDEQMKENPQAVAEKLQQLIEKVFVRKRMLVSFTGEEVSYEKLPRSCTSIWRNFRKEHRRRLQSIRCFLRKMRDLRTPPRSSMWQDPVTLSAMDTHITEP